MIGPQRSERRCAKIYWQTGKNNRKGSGVINSQFTCRELETNLSVPRLVDLLGFIEFYLCLPMLSGKPARRPHGPLR